MRVSLSFAGLVFVPLVLAYAAPPVRPAALAELAAAAPGDSARTASPVEDTAVFAGGCFWGIEGVYRHIKGVKSAVSGFSGGKMASPSYEQVSTGTTGHAESVQVIFDTTKVSYSQLLLVFFTVAHDPTELNYQGPDHGTQYRSAIFYRTDAQKRAAEQMIRQLTEHKVFEDSIVTQIVSLQKFYPAEAYHQNYLALHPRQLYIVVNDLPKIKRLEKTFPSLYRE